MHTLVALGKRIQLGRLLAVLTASFVLLLNVACSNSNAVGARPNNPPVQMGGQNNPHKAVGDGYSEYQMSTDPTVSKRDRSSAVAGQLVANNTGERSFLSKAIQNMGAPLMQSKDSLEEARQIPEQPQEVIDRSDPNVNILEKTGATFKEAAKHLTGSTEKSIERSGVVRSSPNQ